jgi:hypothetical protein
MTVLIRALSCCVLSSFISAGLPALAHGSSQSEIRAFAYQSLHKLVLNSLELAATGARETVADPGGAILILGEIDSPEARSLLVQLTEVYVGAANAEALSYAVARQGRRIKTLLEKLLRQPVECEFLSVARDGQSRLSCLSQGERDRRIRRLLEIIETGEEYSYAL